MFNIGPAELLLIFVVALLVVGPDKLPQVARGLGKAIAKVRQVSSEAQQTLRDALPVEELETLNKVVNPKKAFTSGLFNRPTNPSNPSNPTNPFNPPNGSGAETPQAANGRARIPELPASVDLGPPANFPSTSSASPPANSPAKRLPSTREVHAVDLGPPE